MRIPRAREYGPPQGWGWLRAASLKQKLWRQLARRLSAIKIPEWRLNIV